MISGNLEHTKAFVYSNWSDSPVFNALLISLIDSAKLFTFSESLLVILSIAFTTSYFSLLKDFFKFVDK